MNEGYGYIKQEGFLDINHGHGDGINQVGGGTTDSEWTGP